MEQDADERKRGATQALEMEPKETLESSWTTRGVPTAFGGTRVVNEKREATSSQMNRIE